MKRTIISVLLLLVLGTLLYFGRQKYGKGSNTEQLVTTPIQTPSRVAQLLQDSNTGEASLSTGTDVAIDNLAWFDYEWGWDYKPYFALTVKQALAEKKQVILYFFAERDPTDKALDSDIQKRITRIPANVVISRIDYDTNKQLRDSYNITQQNTLIFLDGDGNEIKRRSMGLTTLSQIVNALKE